MKNLKYLIITFLLLKGFYVNAETKIEGSIAIDARYFTEEALYDEQKSGGLGLVLKPEIYSQLNNGEWEFSFIPFFRLDSQDEDRSHFDIRELMWSSMSDSLTWKLGVSKVFWGVTESQHLIDVINQVDLVEDPTLETKLGQTMINMTWVHDYGHVEGYILPGFRERQFPGVHGRFRSQYIVLSDEAVYESDKKDDHVDYAFRLFNLFGDTEIGLSYFKGTNREPEFITGFRDGNVVLIPQYNQISQTGLDILHQSNRWSFKFEGFHRKGQGDKPFHAITSGIEYAHTWSWLNGSDISWLLEYMYDSRKSNATTPFEHDIFAGLRIALNDVDGTEIRMNGIFDVNNEGKIYTLQMSQRINNEWKYRLLARSYNLSDQDFVYHYRNDDYLEFELVYYY